MEVLIAGATGLIENHLLNTLIDDNHFTKIVILVRQHINIANLKVNQILFDYNNEAKYAKLPAYDAIYCYLRTIIKKVKNKEHFLKVDVEYPKNWPL